jgi:hypothetical protein
MINVSFHADAPSFGTLKVQLVTNKVPTQEKPYNCLHFHNTSGDIDLFVTKEQVEYLIDVLEDWLTAADKAEYEQRMKDFDCIISRINKAFKA